MNCSQEVYGMMCNHEMVQSPAEKKKRFAVYCRVSTESESQLESLENQMKAFRSRLNQHDDWELANLYVDEQLFRKHRLHMHGLQSLSDGITTIYCGFMPLICLFTTIYCFCGREKSSKV